MGMIFIGTEIGTGTGTGTGIVSETVIETVTVTVTEIASETVTVSGIVIATRIVLPALAVTTHSTAMSVSAATAKRNESAHTAAVSSKRMSMTLTTMRNHQV